MRVEQDRNQHEEVAERDGQQLRPRHAGRDQPRRQRVRRDDDRQPDPQRSEVVRPPGPLLDARRRQVLVRQM